MRVVSPAAFHLFLMQIEQRLVTPARYGYIGQICEFVVRAAVGAGLDSRSAFHVQLAVDEACTNIVEHAYGGDGMGDIHVTCQVQDDAFVVTLEDHGVPFDPEKVPAPTVEHDLERLKIGGLGIHFMRKMMDRVEYQFLPGRNRVVMAKKLPRESQ